MKWWHVHHGGQHQTGGLRWKDCPRNAHLGVARGLRLVAGLARTPRPMANKGGALCGRPRGRDYQPPHGAVLVSVIGRQSTARVGFPFVYCCRRCQGDGKLPPKAICRAAATRPSLTPGGASGPQPRRAGPGCAAYGSVSSKVGPQPYLSRCGHPGVAAPTCPCPGGQNPVRISGLAPHGHLVP